MVSSLFEKDPAAFFGFRNLNGFKDFLGYVQLCAPDLFPADDWRGPDEQMTLDRAFAGIRYGLGLVEKLGCNMVVLSRCQVLVKESYADYRAGKNRAGLQKLETIDELLQQPHVVPESPVK
jgi:hypothetical protein